MFQDCIGFIFIILVTVIAVGESRLVAGGTDFEFRLDSASVTAENPNVVGQLRGSGSCGHSSRWSVGVSQDVTWTSGCPALGLVVPSMEHELVKLETRQSLMLLYLGWSTGDMTRPTSYQQPLVQCHDRPDQRDITNRLFPAMLPERLVASRGDGGTRPAAVAVVVTWASLCLGIYRL